VLNGWSYIINATYKVTEKHIRGQNELKLVLLSGKIGDLDQFLSIFIDVLLF